MYYRSDTELGLREIQAGYLAEINWKKVRFNKTNADMLHVVYEVAMIKARQSVSLSTRTETCYFEEAYKVPLDVLWGHIKSGEFMSQNKGESDDK